MRSTSDTSELPTGSIKVNERGSRSLLGHPLAYAVTVGLLFAMFAWPYLFDANRTAPTWDPAFYTWRTEAFIAEPPDAVLEMRGVLGMYDRGYRVGTPLLGTFLRNLGGVSSLRMTIVLIVALPVTLALLLAAVAESLRRGSLTFHVTALAAGGVLFMPPFVGYLDNMLCLVLLTAGLLFIARANHSRSARVGAGLCLVAAGFVHPTSLAIFCGVVIGIALLSMVASPRHLPQRARVELPTIVTVAISTGIVAAAWLVGAWGIPARFADAALSPPYGAERFLDRLGRWVDAMHWERNLPLLVIGAVVIVLAALRAKGGRLMSLSLLWLLPLVGIFGWLAGLSFPYYRFLNATPVWVVLFGLGAAAVIAWAGSLLGRPPSAPLGLLLIVAVVGVMALNVGAGIHRYGPSASGARAGWLSASERRDLDALRNALEASDQHRPIVIVVNSRSSPQVWASTKLAGSTVRYGVPRERLRDLHVYLGDAQNVALDTPTLREEPTYERLSRALFEESRDAIRAEDPIVIVASTFNRNGPNSLVASGKKSVDLGSGELWTLHEGVVSTSGREIASPPPDESSSESGWLRVILGGGGAILLLLPGLVFCVRHPEWGRLPLALGLVPGLSAALLIVSGIALLAVTRVPLSPGVSWGALLLATAAALGLRLVTRPPRRAPSDTEPTPI